MGVSTLASWLVLAICVAPAPAEPPRVVFDMPYAVSCRDVTPPEFAVANPGDKLVEIKLGISSLLQAAQEKGLAQYFLRLGPPSRTTPAPHRPPGAARPDWWAG